MSNTDNTYLSAEDLDMNEDFDEDVMLPNSPLCDYLKDLEVADNDVLHEIFENKSPIQNKIPFKNLFYQNNFKHSNFSLKDKVLSIINIMYSIFLSHVYVVEHYLFTYILEKEESINLLIEEDQVFILNWNAEKRSFKLWDLLRQIFIVIILTLFAVCFVFYTLLNLNTDQNISSIFADWQAMICIYPCFGCLMLLAFNTIEIIQCILMYWRLKNLLFHTKNLCSVIKKCIRLIQESELIVRGFTAASVCSLAERLELSSNLPIVSTQRQYVELRKYIFSQLKDIFMQYRYATKALIDRVSPDLEFDFTCNFLAKLHIKEFGAILQYEMNSDSELQELRTVTDNFSITSLKTMFDLMELQISEYFKCLYLSSTLQAGKQSKCYGLLQTVESSEQRTDITVLSKNMKNLLCKTEENYKYFRCFEVANVNVNKSKISNPSVKPGIILSIHNMALHLKSALSRLIEVEDRFSDKCFDVDNVKNKSVAKEIYSLLQVVKSETSAFEDYFSNCNKFLSEILDDSEKPTIDSHKYKIREDKKMDLIGKHIEKCDDENEILDEVFEDVISKESFVSDAVEDKVFHQEDCIKNLKLLKELKNVLVIKAEEHQNREKIALCRKKEEPNVLQDNNKVDLTDINEKIPKLDNLLGSNEKSNNVDLSDCVIAATKNLIISKNNKCVADISSDTESETEDFNKGLKFLLEQKCENSKFVLSDCKDSFAAAIASMAAQQRQTLGLSCEEFGSEGSDDEDVLNN